MALRAILVSPEFLFRVEADPADVAPGTAYRLSDLELASRLSFFLWSSIPDDELLDAATEGSSSNPRCSKSRSAGCSADPRSNVLVTNFAEQWLYLRNLDSITPDMRLFPTSTTTCARPSAARPNCSSKASCAKTAACSISLRADYTFLNERLAKHYGIPNIYGSRFRRVTLGPDSVRGGLLRQGSILTVTSYATRTSPVIRGKWILENILGAPPPPPPPAVPALDEKTGTSQPHDHARAPRRASRQPRLRELPQLMDPVGFSLENFDAVGRWRTTEERQARRCLRRTARRQQVHRRGRPEAGAAQPARSLRRHVHRKAADLRARPRRRTYDAPAVRKIVRGTKARITVSRPSSSASSTAPRSK